MLAKHGLSLQVDLQAHLGWGASRAAGPSLCRPENIMPMLRREQRTTAIQLPVNLRGISSDRRTAGEHDRS